MNRKRIADGDLEAMRIYANRRAAFWERCAREDLQRPDPDGLALARYLGAAEAFREVVEFCDRWLAPTQPPAEQGGAA